MEKEQSKQNLNCNLPLTEYGHHHIVPEDLDRASGNEVDSAENVPTVDQSVTRWSVGVLESHCQSPQTAFAGTSESFAVLEQGPVQVEADVTLQTLRKPL